MNRKLIQFDKLEVHEVLDDLSKIVGWFKKGKLVKQLKVDRTTSLYDFCPFCLKFYGQLVDMNEKVTFQPEGHKGESYTKYLCPKRDEHCSCGETKHRVMCPLGFDKYFAIP